MCSSDLVSLLKGLAERYGEDVMRYRRGVSIDKLAPIIDDETLRTPEGARGWRVEYYDRDDVSGDPRRVDTTLQSALTYFGAAPPGVDPFDFTVVVTGDYLPTVDGTHDVSLVLTGMGSLRVNGETVVNDPQGLLPRGREYFGFGSEEQLHGIPMKKGVPVRIEARMRTRAGFSALRIGIRSPEDPNEFSDAVALAEESGTAIVVVGTNDEWETEGHDRDTIVLPGRQDELVSRVAKVAKRTIVVVNAGAPVAMPWLEEVDAVLIGFFGGMEMSRAIADVLSGERDPGGRLPIVYPRRLEDSPAMRDYAPVNGVQKYTEGEWFGWRGQARAGVEPLIPFGHGLSYGDSAWGAPRVVVDRAWPKCEVVVPVSCVSARPVTVVVQCYVRRVGDANPPRLAGWAKHTLTSSSASELMIGIPWTAFRRWNQARRAWHIAGGNWEILVAALSVDVRARLTVEIDESESAPSRGSDQPPDRLG